MATAPVCDFAVLSGDAAVLRRWLDALQPDEVVEKSGLALAGWRGPGAHDRVLLSASTDGKNIAFLNGFVANDRELAAEFASRGMRASVEDHPALAADAVAWHGPQGLGALRWQGTLGVAHPGLGQAMLARDLFGVGGLLYGPPQATAQAGLDGGVQLFVNRRRKLAALPAIALQPVPPGVLALIGPRGVQWQRWRPTAGNAAYLADPDEAALRDDTESIRDWLAAGSAALCASAERALGVAPEWAAPPEWWPIALASAKGAGTGARRETSVTRSGGLQLSWAGAESWLPDAKVPVTSQPTWSTALPDAPEPTGSGVPERTRQQRLHRAFGLAESELAEVRETSAAPLVAPALDPPMLARWACLSHARQVAVGQTAG